MIKFVYVLILSSVPLWAYNQSYPILEEARAMTLGHFSNHTQANEERALILEHVMHTVPIWEDRAIEGDWFYEETALAMAPEEPILQWVFSHEYIDETHFVRKIYILNHREDFVGVWKKDNPLSDVKLEDLQPYWGCDILFEQVARGKFVGRSPEHRCVDPYSTGGFFTFEYEMTKHFIKSLPQGVNASGVKTWGNEVPYIFRREDLEEEIFAVED